MIYLLTCDPTGGCGKDYPGNLTECPFCGTDAAFSDPAPIDPRDYVYDIETYPNTFTCCFIHIATDQRWHFEISDRVNHMTEFVEFIRYLGATGARGVGYNNESFDYPVVHQICNNQHWGVAEIYTYAMRVIKASDEEKRGFMVWDNERYFTQLDLLKIHHFDNNSKRTSLKSLEIAMRMRNVSDLPFPLGSMLDDTQKGVLHDYNGDDCVATALFYVRTLPMIKLRERLSETFGVNFLNRNDVKMGEMILVGEMEKAGIVCHEYINKKKVKKKTYRSSIALNDCIFPYVQFERPEFRMIRDYLSRQVITETKGVFSDIVVTPEMIQYMDPEQIKVYGYKGPIYRKVKGERKVGEHKNDRPVKLSNIPPGSNLTGVTYESANLHCVIDGFRFDFGTGGIHSSVSSRVIVTDDTLQIVDVDVTSYYPNLGIKNRIFPAHLGVEFCDAYLGVYHTRQSYSKKTPENGAYKLALNGAFGGSNNEHSPFYDPMYTMKVTINGQLMLCMLVEQMIKIPGLKMIQCNTDGITYHCPKEYMDHQRAVCKWWEAMTCLELEEALYSRMFINNVNNYIAEYEGGELKRIGTYAHLTPDQEPGTRERVWNKDHSSAIVPKIAERVLVEGADPRELVEAHTDPFDFMIRAKVPRSDNLVMHWPEYDIDSPVQGTTRYFVSKTGGELIKVSPPSETEGSWKRAPGIKDAFYRQVCAELIETPPDNPRLDSVGFPYDARIHTKGGSVHSTRRGSMCAGWKVTECAAAEDFDLSRVNVDWYVNEIDKLTEPLLTGASN